MAFPALLQAQFIRMLDEKKIFRTSGWNNYMDTVRNPGALVIEISSEEQLKTVLQELKKLNDSRNPENKITVRVSAGWSDENVSKCCLFPWSKVQESQYNEGYSFSQVVGGRKTSESPGTDIIIRFAKKFHKMKVLGSLANPQVTNPNTPIHQLPSSLVEVSAGVQVAELAEFLRKNNLSLTTVSMISWVTAVGLAGTGGHGTGRDEPAFSGLIESFKLCDMDGTIREIDRQHPDFESLCGAHSGLLGVVLSIKLRAVSAFNLRETIDVFYSAKEMKGELDAVLRDNEYISIMGIPSYSCEEQKGLSVPKWQIRKWNHTEEKPTQHAPAPYAPDVRSFNQELEVVLGASTMDFLLDSGLQHLLPYFMVLSAAMVIGTRGTTPIVDYENHITHPQVAFPREMRDVSYLIPVNDLEAGEKLELILKKMERLLNSGAKKNGEIPITYAIYVRYMQGTNGGLSTSSTHSNDQRILAIDVVTHPEAPGIGHFEQDFLTFLKDNDLAPRNHLGKNFPIGVERYDQFLDSDALDEYRSALVRWHETPGAHDGPQRLSTSPFLTPYLESMLSPSVSLIQTKSDDRIIKPNFKLRPHKNHTEVQRRDFLTKLHEEISKRELTSEEGKAAKQVFLQKCSVALEKINESLNRLQPVS